MRALRGKVQRVLKLAVGAGLDLKDDWTAERNDCNGQDRVAVEQETVQVSPFQGLAPYQLTNLEMDSVILDVICGLPHSHGCL